MPDWHQTLRMDSADPAMTSPVITTDSSRFPALLPFAYAKRHGVLLRDQVLQVRRGASLAFVQEAQRFAGRLLPLSWLEPEVFEHELAQAYQRDSSEVRQMAEGLGAELDLASLAELTPESGDLLEKVGIKIS